MTQPIFFAALLAVGAVQPMPMRTQVFFTQPSGMKVYWQTKQDGKAVFSKTPLEAPGRYNFAEGATYRLKLTHLPGHAGLELYPTLEVVRRSPASREFLDHNSVPFLLTEDDINQVVKGNYLTRVVYLPLRQISDTEIATASGPDAIAEAQRRGHILLVVRVGNIIEPPTTDKK